MICFKKPVYSANLKRRVFGALEGTRTPDPLLRRQLLYPAELQALNVDYYIH